MKPRCDLGPHGGSILANCCQPELAPQMACFAIVKQCAIAPQRVYVGGARRASACAVFGAAIQTAGGHDECEHKPAISSEN